jgi:pilus assembly protein CpaF
LEILVDGADHVYVDRYGEGLADVPSPFRDEAHLLGVIDAIFAPLGQKIDAACPWGDGHLPDGSRVNVVIPPVSLTGPTMVIRKLRSRQISMEEAVRRGSLTDDMVAFIQACVAARLNTVVAGGIGTGKTTVLNFLQGMVPPDERIVTVEVDGELRLPDTLKRVVRLVSRPPDAAGKGAVTMQDLLVNSMRMRPDRIVVSDVQGAEAVTLLQAMDMGHDGVSFKLHANSPRDAIARLEMLATFADTSVPLLTIRQMIASSLDIIIYLERLRDGARKMAAIAEVTGMQGDVVGIENIYEFRETGISEEGRIAGEFAATGYVPRCLERVRTTGVALPADLLALGS